MTESTPKVAVVTGAASGIGRALATRFRSEGFDVVLADVSEAQLALAANEIGATACRTDVSKIEDVERLRDVALSTYGRVDVVCNNAGVAHPGRVSEISLAEWRSVLEINLFGVINGVHTFLPTLRDNPDGGYFINTSSGAGLAPAWSTAPYSVSKYGVVALSEILRRELAEDSPNVGVTVLVPTATATNIVASSRDVLPAADREMTSGEISRTEVTRTRLAEGMSADAVADVAWHAYQDRRFWAMAADVTAEWVMERALEIQASTPSALARAGSSESKGSK